MNSAIRVFNEGMAGNDLSVEDLMSITSSDFHILIDKIAEAGDVAIVA